MAFAPFFDRAQQSASQVIRDFNAETFKRRLSEVTVVLAYDVHAAASAESRTALDMAARLTARLYPRVAVQGPTEDEGLATQLLDLMRSINPEIEVVDVNDGERISVAAGMTAYDGLAIYMGSDRWVAHVSTQGPVECGESANPFGAGAAACLALANVFRAVFRDWLPHPDLDSDIRLSLLNFETDTQAENVDLPSDLDFGLVQLVGVGAIGNAFIWAMAHCQSVTGSLHLIDGEMIEASNLQRYVLPTMDDIDAVKVELAGRLLAGSKIVVEEHQSTWSDYIQTKGHHNFEKVAVALDTARDRVEVQSSLPRRVINSWTQAGDLGVSRHDFIGDYACLSCLYLPSGLRRNEDEIIAEELRFPPEQLMAVRELLHFNTLMDADLVTQIAAQLGVNVDVLMPFINLPLRAFRQKAICGNAIMQAADGGGSEIEVPLAFQSALAGIMLAAEIVASSPGVRDASISTRTSINLMRRLPKLITVPVRKGVPGPARCICEDRDYIEVYQEKYGVI